MNRSFKNLVAPAVLGLLLAAPAVGYSQQSPVTGAIYGYNTFAAPSGGSVVSQGFVKNSVYSGAVTVSGSTFLATGITVNSLAPTAYSDRPNAPRYYVEITTGAYAGTSYDVESNDSNGITVFGLPGDLNGQSNIVIAVRPHYTLGDLANASTGLSTFTDTFTLYQGNNSQSSYYFSGNGVVGGDYLTPESQTVLYPGTGALLNNSGNATFTVSGLVKTNQTVVPVYAGVNLLAPVDPSGTTSMTSENLALILQPYSDSVSLVATDGSLATTPFYSDGSQLLDQNYAPLNPAGAPVVAVGNGFFVNTSQNGLWTNLKILTSY